MGRPENEVDQTVPARAALAKFLRERRHAAGLTYRQMSKNRGGRPSAATLERAAAGTTVPAWDTIEHFITATLTENDLFGPEMLLARAHELWIRARRATRAPYYVHTAPDPTLIADTADLLRALRHQHVWAGYPSPGEMQATAGGWALPKSTTQRIIDGLTLPVDPPQALAFLRACYVQEETELERWLDAAVRALKNDPPRRFKDIGTWIRAHRAMVGKTRETERAPVTPLHDQTGPRAA
ncbi:hypothetical protein AB0L33_34160 [Streptomyces sp. NPDC052299]|uniref:hypothetical protein n=1 Tax=Streptomyces sp. NPDC052299 TaxID=3155054 RepID=UPI003438DEBE